MDFAEPGVFWHSADIHSADASEVDVQMGFGIALISTINDIPVGAFKVVLVTNSGYLDTRDLRQLLYKLVPISRQAKPQLVDYAFVTLPYPSGNLRQAVCIRENVFKYLHSCFGSHLSRQVSFT